MCAADRTHRKEPLGVGADAKGGESHLHDHRNQLPTARNCTFRFQRRSSDDFLKGVAHGIPDR